MQKLLDTVMEALVLELDKPIKDPVILDALNRLLFTILDGISK
jgi:hypothetical protein